MTPVPEEIATERLQLRCPRATDVADIFTYASDSEVTRFMDWPIHTSAQTAADWIADCASQWHSGAEFTWLMAKRTEDRAIGAISLRVTEYKADFGYVLNRRLWGQGLATEAARAIVELAARIDGVYRIWATCDIDNAASARVLEKSGLAREGILRCWAKRPNISAVPRDSLVFGKVVRSA